MMGKMGMMGMGGMDGMGGMGMMGMMGMMGKMGMMGMGGMDGMGMMGKMGMMGMGGMGGMGNCGVEYFYGDAQTGNSCPISDSHVNEADCLAAVEALLPAGQTQGRTNLVAGSWGWVPPGCSVQSHFTHGQDGDWAAHYNRNPAGSNDGGYTPLCEMAGDECGMGMGMGGMGMMGMMGMGMMGMDGMGMMGMGMMGMDGMGGMGGMGMMGTGGIVPLVTLHWDGGRMDLTEEITCLSGAFMIRNELSVPNDELTGISGLKPGCEVKLFEHSQGCRASEDAEDNCDDQLCVTLDSDTMSLGAIASKVSGVTVVCDVPGMGGMGGMGMMGMMG